MPRWIGRTRHSRFQAAANLSIDALNDTINVADSISATGTGHLLLNNGSFVPRLPDSGASENATFNFPDGIAQITAVYIYVTSYNSIIKFTNTGFLDFVGSAPHNPVGLTNQGTIRVSGTADLVLEGGLAIANNTATGLIDLQTNAELSRLGRYFQNHGTIRKSGGVGSSSNT
jgi:hypothetical protein